MMRFSTVTLSILLLSGCCTSTFGEFQEESYTSWQTSETRFRNTNQKIREVFAYSEEFSLIPPNEGRQRAKLTFRNHPTSGKNVILEVQKGIFPHVTALSPMEIQFDKTRTLWKNNNPHGHSRRELYLFGYRRMMKYVRSREKMIIFAPIEKHGRIALEFDTLGLGATLDNFLHN